MLNYEEIKRVKSNKVLIHIPPILRALPPRQLYTISHDEVDQLMVTCSYFPLVVTGRIKGADHTGPLYLWSNYESNQQDATKLVNLLFLVSSTCLGSRFRPSSGALDCIYSIWQYSAKLLPASVSDKLELLCSFNSSKTPAGSNLGEYYQIL